MFIGLIVGMLLVAALPAAADEITKRVTATIRNDFTISLDGEAVTLKTPPLAYDGASYLPVRELATILGKDVDFKDGVIMLDTPVISGDPAEELEKLKYNIEMLNRNIEQSQQRLSDYENGKEDISEKDLGIIDDLIRLSRQQIEIVQSKIDALIEQYPELAE